MVVSQDLRIYFTAEPLNEQKCNSELIWCHNVWNIPGHCVAANLSHKLHPSCALECPSGGLDSDVDSAPWYLGSGFPCSAVCDASRAAACGAGGVVAAGCAMGRGATRAAGGRAVAGETGVGHRGAGTDHTQARPQGSQVQSPHYNPNVVQTPHRLPLSDSKARSPSLPSQGVSSESLRARTIVGR
jgi:hypothetical protein